MKKALIYVFVFVLQISYSQDMTTTKIGNLLNSVSDDIIKSENQWHFKIKEIPLVCIVDSNHNRMRIISPIAESDSLSSELKTATLAANFHSTLDVRYAIADNVLWSVFVHPLKELTEQQTLDAVNQVYHASKNFGSSFSSSSLVFPERKQTSEIEHVITQEKQLVDRI